VAGSPLARNRANACDAGLQVSHAHRMTAMCAQRKWRRLARGHFGNEGCVAVCRRFSSNSREPQSDRDTRRLHFGRQSACACASSRVLQLTRYLVSHR
jgi:hypothetical protein